MKINSENNSSLPAPFVEAALEYVSDGIVACDANGAILKFNRVSRDDHGFDTLPSCPKDWLKDFQFLKKSDGSPFKPEELPLYRALNGEYIRDLENAVYTKAGLKTFLCNAQPVFDKDGVKLGAILTVKDITTEKEASQKSEKRFRTLFEQSPLSIQICSPDGKTTAVNSSWKRQVGVSDEFVQNYILKEYNVLEDKILERQGILHLVKEAFTGKSVKTPAILYDPKENNKEGRPTWTQAFLHPVFDEQNQLKEIVLIHEDVTEIKEAEKKLKAAKEEAEQANKLKSLFLANMSHEIRTPLSAMIGYAQLLQTRSANSDEAKKYLDVIERNAISLSKIIDDILDLSKVEAGRLEVTKVTVNLKTLLDEVAGLFQLQAEEKNIKFHTRGVPPALKKIKTDPLRLRQILINLIGNALKFTHSGTITVEVSEQNSCAKISVIDTGVGIAEEMHKELFQSFSQADNSFSRRFNGTGLGLALSRKLAAAIGGDVYLEKSKIGEGSIFSTIVPIGDTAGLAVQPAHDNTLDIKTSELEGLCLLVADDSDDLRNLIKQFLELKGARVCEVTNGAEAVNKAFDCAAVLMDIQMPKMDGLDATRTLRKAGYTKPIIALTAHALVEERKSSLDAGADAHLTKPINFHELLNTIKKFVFDD